MKKAAKTAKKAAKKRVDNGAGDDFKMDLEEPARKTRDRSRSKSKSVKDAYCKECSRKIRRGAVECCDCKSCFHLRLPRKL